MTLELLALLAVCWLVLVPSLITGLALRRARFAESLAADLPRASLRCEGRTRAPGPVLGASRTPLTLGE